MSFTSRTHIFRKSDPGLKGKPKKERFNNNDPELISCIKRRGGSLARPEYYRENSFNNKLSEHASNRNSVFDPTRLEGSHTGGTKIMNFIKSGLHLSRFKSKSKLNLNEQRQSLYSDSQASKSEENIFGLEFDSYATPIRVSNLVLNSDDPTLYVSTFTSSGESLRKPVVVLDNDCIVQAVHSSIVNGQNYCFQIIKRMKSEISIYPFSSINTNKDSFETSQIIKSCSYNSSFRDHKSASENIESVNIIRCPTIIQRNEWIMKIKSHINPNIEHTVRHEDILKIWIQEGKNLLHKKRYYCEIKLDQILYSRTTIKVMNDTVFWGEEFEFTGLQNVNTISVSVYRIVDSKKKRDKSELVAVINLNCEEVLHNSFTEKWYSTSRDLLPSTEHLRYSQAMSSKSGNSSAFNTDQLLKSVIESTPMLRIKARYRPLEIIPITYYKTLIDYVIEDNIQLVMSLENHLKVKSKEEFVNTLLLILQKKDKHIIFLSDVILMEVSKSDDNLILRGNSMASKAMECYLKIVGEKYLSTILSDMIDQVITQVIDCEVDPLRIPNLKDYSTITNNQRKLIGIVEGVWHKIFSTSHLLPEDLKSVFTVIRDKLCCNKRLLPNSMIDQVISSCLFLRYICPAIMSPFLFGLSNEYSDKLCINRTFTLVAKCIQSLANFSQSHHGKEAYMGFLQDFLTNNTNQMHIFLKQISTKKPYTEAILYKSGDYTKAARKSLSQNVDMSIDLGYQLAELSYQLSFHLKEIPVKDYTASLTKARSIFENISRSVPNVEPRDENATMSNNFRSQIPVAIQRLSSTVSTDLALKSVKYSHKLRPDIEEDFSYIPYGDKGDPPRATNENYVDFECIESTLYDDASSENLYSKFVSLDKSVNEKEINEGWKKIVTESLDNVMADYRYSNSDANNCTLNSSGYESLNLPPKRYIQLEPESKTLNRYPSPLSGQHMEDIADNVPESLNSPKLAPARQANIYRRIKKNSNIGSPDVKVAEKSKISAPNINFNLNSSYDTLGSIENLSGSENSSLKVSKSMSSVYQKKALTNKSKNMHFNVERSESDNMKNTMESSMVKLFRRSSQSLSNSISSNVDLDSFVSNELKRLQLFFEYYQIQRPSSYQGNAVEQYKCKTLDENVLKRTLVKKPYFNRDDILDYIKASHRLLKSINKPGQISTDFVIKSIMEVNQSIQSCIRLEHERILSANDTDFRLGKAVVSSLKSPSLESYSSSTQSLPAPLFRNSKQSQKTGPNFVISQETNSSLNLTKGLIVHSVFDRC